MTNDISAAVQVIHTGRVVAFPTGTSYGLAVDALQGNALQRLRNLKNRPEEKTFTVFLRENLWDVFLKLTDEERAILRKYVDQPLTLLVQPQKSLRHLAQDGRVGLRVIDHPMMERLAQAVDVPLTATSANISGAPACYDVASILASFSGLLDPADTRHGDIRRARESTYDLSLGAILDGGVLSPNRVSTIARLDHGDLKIIRQGSLQLSQNHNWNGL